MANIVLNSQSRRLVLNVIEYFQNIKDTTTDIVSVIDCTAKAMKISQRTVSRIRQQGVEGIQKKVNVFVVAIFMASIFGSLN